jgi:hypothetical protein
MMADEDATKSISLRSHCIGYNKDQSVLSAQRPIGPKDLEHLVFMEFFDLPCRRR